MMIVKIGCALLCVYLFHATVNCAAEIDSSACLKAHNDKRKLHGANALIWDATLAQHATDWAAELVKLGIMQHATGTGEGENLFSGAKSTGVYACSYAVQLWYDEVKNYPFSNPPRKLSDVPKTIGHFTQVVWKSTTKVGVGIGHVKSNGVEQTYIVARYSPPGNYQGQFAANVGNKITALSLKCYNCSDCGDTNGDEKSCPYGFDKCLTVSGKDGTDRSCTNQQGCDSAKGKCKDAECDTVCCDSDLCNSGAALSFSVFLIFLCSLFAVMPFFK